ncbi:MAG: response regulator, partial [Rhodospirillaceae bacterium]|nr:response regulator [Rhodospirillaceae bacterium]
CATFAPSDIFQSVNELLEPIAAERGIRLAFDVSESVAQTMMGDPKRLRQVLVNLTGNALKFTERGTVAVNADCYPGDTGDDVLHVSVSDTGIGISDADQQNLFKPYVQAESGASARSLGTGLGLSICKLLVEAMGGEITVASREGSGSTFTFSVRLQPDRAHSAQALRRQSNVSVKAVPLRILAAEDNETSRYLVQSMLERKGHAVDTVENGALAIEAVKQQNYDLVLMDMQMPVMDGKDAVRVIRKLGGAYATLPIIALTADMVDENRSTYFDAGIDALVGKPVDWTVLDNEMMRLTGPRGAGLGTAGAPFASNGSPAAITDIDFGTLASVVDLLGLEKFDKLVASFRENMQKYKVDMQQNVSANDLRQVRRTAHSIKGLALQFGATTVGQMAARMETDAMGITEMTTQLPLFDQKITEALDAISQPGLAEQLLNPPIAP